ncbi:MAG: beta-galactosidase trimerization domain-containing protein [Oscillospiraceae bacterium]|nr:beta-galactosidase trimerization domain-containing protein [Oscillospiraceae bacterium]
MAKNIPWNSRITWYVYDDKQIMEYTESDFEKDAKTLSDLGTNIILLGNKVHFRFDYYPYWNIINDTLGKLIRAFHKYGIKVVEHHSCSLCHCMTAPEKLPRNWERGNPDDKRVKDFWKKAFDFVTHDSKIDGVNVQSMMQIDGSTGELGISPYKTHTFCYNNEDYRRIYFKYLESVYAVNPDGIMTDDIQYYNNGNACTCPTCRRLFKEQTGYSMPESADEWKNNFFGDYSNPVYVAFDKFRRDSAERMQRDVQAHFRSLGLNLLRPNYISSEVLQNMTAYPFDNVCDLWDVMFQENCYSYITKYSWPEFDCEATHRYAFASKNGIPSMSMFYDMKPYNSYFSWSLAQSWGQLYNGSFDMVPEMLEYEGLLRGIEKKYPQYFYDQKKKSDYSVFFSKKNRDLIADPISSSTLSIYTWLQSGIFTQKSGDFVLENSETKELAAKRVIVLSHVFMLSEEEIKSFADYAYNGGTLVLVDLCGKKTTEGIDRSPEEIQKLFGYKTKIIPINETAASAQMNGKMLGEMTYCLTYENSDPIAITDFGTVIASEKTGKGRIVFVGAKTNEIMPHMSAGAERSSHIGTSSAQKYTVNIMRSTIGSILDYLIPSPIMEIDDEKYKLSCFDSADRKTILTHIINVGNTLSKVDGAPITHLDVIPDFVIGGESAIKNKKLCLSVKTDKTIKNAYLISPEIARGEKQSVLFSLSGNKVTVTIPEGIFSGYALIALE